MYVYVRNLLCVPLDVCENGKHFDKLYKYMYYCTSIISNYIYKKFVQKRAEFKLRQGHLAN
jgi:hypothetical protein